MKADAQKLLETSGNKAYYDAQRLAARGHFSGDGAEFLHWTRVAAEVAKLSDCAIDREAVARVFREEETRAASRSK